MEGLAPLQLIRLFLCFILLMPLGGCFDYEERLLVRPTGAVNAKIHTLLPPWLRALPQAAGVFYPATATALAQQVGLGVKPVFTSQGGPVDGFEGRVRAIERLDTRLIRHQLTFAKGGAYSFRVTLTPPRDFAAAVSEAVTLRMAAMPRLPLTNRERVREAALSELGYRLEAELPGEITASNGHAAGSVVFWSVPLRQLIAGKPVELLATGRLSTMERIGRKLGFSLSF